MPEFPDIQIIPPTPTRHWWDDPPQTIEDATVLLERRAAFINSTSEEGTHLRHLLDWVQESYNDTLDLVKEKYPCAFFRPSYEQSLLLNAWWCGVSFPICFSANRIGKTACFVFNGILWIFPNNPQWDCFQKYTDHLDRPVEILQRPPIENLLRLQAFLTRYPHLQGDPNFSHLDENSGNSEKFAALQIQAPFLFSPAWPSPPISKGETIWLGAPDRDFHKHIILKEWKRWLPPHSIKHWSDSDLSFVLSTLEETNPTPTAIELVCKSYESKDTKWSGAAVAGIILTEGLEPDVLDEIKQRVKENAFASWDYTPYEARNVGKKTALAFRVMKGAEELPLTPHVFTNFSARNAPAHILPTSKRDDLIRMWEGKPEGQARLDGAFFSDSPMILSRLDRPFHALQISFEELLHLYPTARLYRGIDPGYDHPTCCAWGALLPSNIWVIYRFYSKQGTTVGQRVKDIIKLSNNAREKYQFGPRPEQFMFREVHPYHNSEVYNGTFIDYHTFKADEVTGTSYANNYRSEGLPISESTHMSPRDRAQEINKLLEKQNYLTHPTNKTAPSARLYFLINEPGVAEALEKMESLFWERYSTGNRKGQPKDEVEKENDDELDAACYITCSPVRWHPHTPARIDSYKVEPWDEE